MRYREYVGVYIGCFLFFGFFSLGRKGGLGGRIVRERRGMGWRLVGRLVGG